MSFVGLLFSLCEEAHRLDGMRKAPPLVFILWRLEALAAARAVAMTGASLSCWSLLSERELLHEETEGRGEGQGGEDDVRQRDTVEQEEEEVIENL